MALISVDNLTHTYGAHSPFEKHAIRGVTLDIHEGELLGIIGHTGSGKSTLIQHLNGLLRPNEGRVLLDGVDIWENPKKIRSVRFRVGMVFQYPEHQLFEDTIYKDIAFGPKNMGLSESEIGDTVDLTARGTELKVTGNGEEFVFEGMDDFCDAVDADLFSNQKLDNVRNLFSLKHDAA